MRSFSRSVFSFVEQEIDEPTDAVHALWIAMKPGDTLLGYFVENTFLMAEQLR